MQTTNTQAVHVICPECGERVPTRSYAPNVRLVHGRKDSVRWTRCAGSGGTITDAEREEALAYRVQYHTEQQASAARDEARQDLVRAELAVEQATKRLAVAEKYLAMAVRLMDEALDRRDRARAAFDRSS